MFSSLVPVGTRSASLLGSPLGFLPTLRPAIVVSLRESQCFPRSRLSAFARRRYSEAHWASSLRSALEP